MAAARVSTGRQASAGSAGRKAVAYALEEQIGFLLRKAHQRATAIFLRRFGPRQITPTQWAALAKIHEQGSVSQNRLGRLTAMDQATIQGVIRRLAARRLVAHVPDAQDRRRKRLSLTTAGTELVEGLLADARAVSRETLGPLDAESRRRFLELLERLS